MELLAHQKLSINGMNKSIEDGKNLFILSDDIGSGKTVTFLSFLKTRKERCIIFVPSNIIHKWKETINSVLPDIRFDLILKRRQKYKKDVELFLSVKSAFGELTKTFPDYAICIDEMETFNQIMSNNTDYKMENDHKIPFMCIISANKHIYHGWFSEKSIKYMEEKVNEPNLVFDSTLSLDILLDEVVGNMITDFCDDIDFGELYKLRTFNEFISYINEKGVIYCTLILKRLYKVKADITRSINYEFTSNTKKILDHKILVEELYESPTSGSLETDAQIQKFFNNISKSQKLEEGIIKKHGFMGKSLKLLAETNNEIKIRESYKVNKIDEKKVKSQFTKNKVTIYTNSIKIYNKIDDGDIIPFYKNNFKHKCKFTEVMSLLNKYTDFESKLKVYDVSGVLKSLKLSILANTDGNVVKSINEDKFNIVVILRMFKETKLNNLKAKDNKTENDLERIKMFENDIKEINKTYNEILEEPCKICLNPNESKIMIYSCCQFLICENCKIRVKECPFCRNKENVAKFFGEFVNSPDRKRISDTVINYIDKLKEITKDGESILLFCNNLQSKVYKIIDCNILKGNSTHRNTIIENYKSKKIKTLLINSKNDFSGICLENTTDIIFLDDPDDDQEKQFLGRALRLGRTNANINIHRFEFVK